MEVAVEVEVEDFLGFEREEGLQRNEANGLGRAWARMGIQGRVIRKRESQRLSEVFR